MIANNIFKKPFSRYHAIARVILSNYFDTLEHTSLANLLGEGVSDLESVRLQA